VTDDIGVGQHVCTLQLVRYAKANDGDEKCFVTGTRRNEENSESSYNRIIDSGRSVNLILNH